MGAAIRSKYGWAAVSAALVAAAGPGGGAFPLGFVALVPLFFALEPGRGARVGLVFGAVFFALDLRWILTLVRFHPLVVPGYALLVAYLAVPFAAFGAIVRWGAPRPSGRLLLLAPSVFVLLEILRTLGPLGMGFSALYLSLHPVPALIQSASLLGPWSVSGLLVAVNASLYLAIRRRSARYAAAAVGFVAAMAAFSLVPSAPDAGAPLRVAVISSMIPQEVKLDARNLPDLEERYGALAATALAAGPDLLVFPESILPAFILRDERLLASMRARAEEGGASVLFGTGDMRGRALYNTVVLIDPTGAIAGVYDMVRPVPFGEYIPGRALLDRIGLGGWARSFLARDLSRGGGHEPLGPIGTPICFESTFPGPARAFAARGARFLAILTNDAWFDGSSELPAHFAAAVFRAVETRRWVVQSANGGISGIIDPIGRVRDSTVDETVVVGSIVPRDDQSLYTRWGDGPLAAAAGGLFAAGVAARIGRRQRDGE